MRGEILKDLSRDIIMFKAFSDEKRLEILSFLKYGEKCACELIEKMGISQSSLSYHMKILCESGIVSSREEGKWTYYNLCDNGREYALKRVMELTTPYVDN